jgi:hypothetical protein
LLDEEVANFKYEHNGTASTELPALAAKDELRNLGYLADNQNLLFAKAGPTVNRPLVNYLSYRSTDSLKPALSSSNQALDAASPEMKSVLRLLPPKPYTGPFF